MEKQPEVDVIDATIKALELLKSDLRRQVSQEIGDDDLSYEKRQMMLMKFGVMPARIDRKVTRPYWKMESEWNREMQAWFLATKKLVPAFQQKRPMTSENSKAKPWSQVKHKRQNRNQQTPISRPAGR